MDEDDGKPRAEYATARTPVLAALHLQIAQTHLLEMMKSEPPGNRPADEAYQLVARAVSILSTHLPAGDE